MPRLNIYENLSVAHQMNIGRPVAWTNTLNIHHVYIPGSISWNNVIIVGTNADTSRTQSVYIGLYSLNGATLSLANSASGSFNYSNATSWLTLVTSAAQDITPGDWWIGYRSESSGANGGIYFYNAQNAFGSGGRGIGGPFVRGIMTVSTDGMPSSIATSDCQNEGDNSNSDTFSHPYILIAA